MRNGHPQYRQLIRFSRESTARRNHVTQLGYVGRHFVATSPLDFAMIFPTAKYDKITKTFNVHPRLARNKAISQNQHVSQCNKKVSFEFSWETKFLRPGSIRRFCRWNLLISILKGFPSFVLMNNLIENKRSKSIFLKMTTPTNQPFCFCSPLKFSKNHWNPSLHAALHSPREPLLLLNIFVVHFKVFLILNTL